MLSFYIDPGSRFNSCGDVFCTNLKNVLVQAGVEIAIRELWEAIPKVKNIKKLRSKLSKIVFSNFWSLDAGIHDF